MFSQATVILSTGGCAWQGWDVCGREHAWWRVAWQGVVCGRGCAWWGACVVAACVAEGACVAGETAIVADGTHPTGLHSCVNI